MNTLKKIFAITLCLLLSFTCLAGCHEKGEIAVTVGDYTFTSGYYACALVYADMEARALVDAELSMQDASEEDAQDATESTTESAPEEVVYHEHKVEDTDYVKWVEDTALATLKKVAAAKTLCAKAGVTLSAEDESLAKENVNLIWNEYGYSELMENNGVSKETFIEYMKDGFLTDSYFDHLYGKGGEKEVNAKKINKQLSDNYALVNTIDVDFSEFSEDQIKQETEKFQAYEKDLKDGKKTFEQVLLDYTNTSAEDHKHEEAHEGEPKDPHATILGSEETEYFSENFEKAKEMKVGEVKLLTLEDQAGLSLVVKQDIMDDPYYLNTLDSELRHGVIGDAFEEDIVKFAEGLAVEINKSSTKQFNVKKMEYPETAAY
ncbi:MAG: hypothetical protein IKJ93_03305 [Clostridia bacterium]|nr:hypothetical protein [Clostridia bacterium]